MRARVGDWLMWALLSAGCSARPAEVDGRFGVPSAVAIAGYSGDAMEPFVSPDGSYLLFNNSNAPGVDTNLFYATPVDDLTFQFQGPIAGANSPSLDAVASLDAQGELFFVSTRSYAQTLSSVFSGAFVAGGLTDPVLVPGVSRNTAGVVNFDAAISPDGQSLYLVDGTFTGAPTPTAADLVVAGRTATGFARLADSPSIFAQINTPSLEYAPCISRDGLELFFTRLTDAGTAIFSARRSAPTAPFAPPKRVAAISGTHVEAPALSPDGLSLYFHQQVGGLYSIFRVHRDP